MERYICIHGHFYQPPRENPWLEEVELQDSAYPYHDWNSRITVECYRPNAASRILGPDKKIVDIVNNYAKMSFNFGPTLLSWLQRQAVDVYDAILEADQKSLYLYDGHGAALAQAYSHMIMPLANRRDKRTQVLWGLRDFESRFRRKPEGMWLPETAVDYETLEVLAEHGLKFTILAPRQAKSIRRMGENEWAHLDKEQIDTTMPYRCPLPSGQSIDLFFYHGPTAQSVASGRYLQNGELLAEKLLWVLQDHGQSAGLAHIATDGETFGHHHRYTDMALAYCLHHIESNNLARPTVYGQYLELFPPTHEVQIYENSSWSCDHGVERWRSNCGCHLGRYPSGLQQWRKPLREGLDWLRDQLALVYEYRMQSLYIDPWELRNHYIDVVNDRSKAGLKRFWSTHFQSEPTRSNQVLILKLLEMQRQAMLMYTSCGWFFDDIAGIETVQIQQYAARAIQLAKEVENKDFEPGLLEFLEQANCNERGYAQGRDVYEKLVKPNNVDLNRVGAHLAINSIFEKTPKKMDIYCYHADVESYEKHEAGLQVLATGRADITSQIVWERHRLDFAVLHLGDRNLLCAVDARMDDAAFAAICSQLKAAYDRGDSTEMMRIMTVSFGQNSYSLWHLFKDQQRKVLFQLLESTWKEIEASYRQIYEHNFTIMQLMHGMHMPLPKALAGPAEFVVNEDLRRTIHGEDFELDRLQDLIDEANRLSLNLDSETLQYEASHKICFLLCKLENHPESLNLLKNVEATVRALKQVAKQLNIQTAQNIFFDLSRKVYPAMKEKPEAQEWVELFEKLGQHLDVVVDEEEKSGDQ